MNQRSHPLIIYGLIIAFDLRNFSGYVKMNVRQMRKQLSTEFERDTKKAITTALRIVALEPSEGINYRNLAICYSKLADLDRAFATIQIGESSTQEENWLWTKTKAEILRDNNQNADLTLVLFDYVTHKAHIDENVLNDLRAFTPHLDLNTIEAQFENLTKKMERTNPFWIDICYKLYEHEKHGLVSVVLNIFLDDAHLDYERKKLLSIICNNGNLSSRGQHLLELMIDEAPTCQDKQNDLLELTKIFAKIGAIEQAIATLNRILSINPHNLEALKVKNFYLHYSASATIQEIKETAEKLRQLIPTEKILHQKSKPNLAKKPVKIGFLSNSFNMHPVGWMTAGFFCECPQFSDQAEIHILSLGIKNDFVSNTIKYSKNHFHDLSKIESHNLTSVITDLALDILVDLDGLSVNSNIEAILSKPAPILIKWVGGLIGSTWLPEFDYLVTDDQQTPLQLDSDFSEKLIKVSPSYVTYTPPPYKLRRHAPPCSVNDHICFGSFNNIAKLSHPCLDAWAAILHEVADSILFLKDKNTGDPATQARLIDEFHQRGINSERIKFWLPSDHKQHLKSLQLVDIALDSFPYTGGLSTIEALLMGVPVVALSGRLLSHRHSTTHIRTCGHDELLASSIDEYRRIAIELANNRTRIFHYRRTLPDALEKSGLLQHKNFTKDFINKMVALVE